MRDGTLPASAVIDDNLHVFLRHAAFVGRRFALRPGVQRVPATRGAWRPAARAACDAGDAGDDPPPSTVPIFDIPDVAVGETAACGRRQPDRRAGRRCGRRARGRRGWSDDRRRPVRPIKRCNGARRRSGDPANCGLCGATPAGACAWWGEAQARPGGLTACGDAASTRQSDSAHCGAGAGRRATRGWAAVAVPVAGCSPTRAGALRGAAARRWSSGAGGARGGETRPLGDLLVTRPADDDAAGHRRFSTAPGGPYAPAASGGRRRQRALSNTNPTEVGGARCGSGRAGASARAARAAGAQASTAVPQQRADAHRGRRGARQRRRARNVAGGGHRDVATSRRDRRPDGELPPRGARPVTVEPLRDCSRWRRCPRRRARRGGADAQRQRPHRPRQRGAGDARHRPPPRPTCGRYYPEHRQPSAGRRSSRTAGRRLHRRRRGGDGADRDHPRPGASSTW